MAVSRRRTGIGAEEKGIFLTVLTDKKLKTNNFIIHFITGLTEQTAAANAAAAFMLEDSCEGYPDITALSRRLAELYGANIRSGVSQFHDNQTVTVTGSCIADKYALQGEEISYSLLELLCGCIFRPVTETTDSGEKKFPEKQFGLKKQELIDDIDADINDKRLYADKKARRIIYENEPAGLSPKGERAAALSLTSEQVYKAYKELLRSARIEIIFVGPELPEKCEQLIRSEFGAIERENVCVPVNKPSPVKKEPRYVTDHLDVVQSKMVIAFKHEGEGDLSAVERVFNAVFGSTPFSLLFKNVREKLSLCYYCAAAFNPVKRAVYVDSGVESSNIDAAREEIFRQLEAVKAGEFSDELFEQSKLYLICALKGVDDSPRSTADWYYDRCLSPEEDIVTPEEYIKLIEKVTKEDVCAYARSLVPDTVYVLTRAEPAATR